MTPPQSNQQPLTQPNLLQPMVPQTQPLPDLTSQQPFIQPQATQPTLIQPLIPQSNQISNPPLTQFFPNLQQPMQPQTLQPQMLFPNAQPQQLFPTMQPLISALPQPQVLQPQILQPQQSSQTQQQQQFALF